jgi:pimeloyl-ACP methyl ester carboxylesterase
VTPQHHRLVANGIDLHFVTAGSGPPLVLIHGFPQTWYQWRHLIDRLADRFTIIAPDLRGIGASPGPATGYDKHSLAGDVKAIVSHVCGDEPALVIGHDMGSFVAFAYALRYWEQVRGLMLVDAPPPGTIIFESGKGRAWHIAFHSQRDVAEMLVASKERPYIAQFIASRIYDNAAISEEDIDIYAAAYRAPGAMRAAFEMYRTLDEDAGLNRAALADGKLPMPVVFVGAAGRMTSAPLEAMGSEIADDLRVILLDRCGHWISEEQPDALAAAISELAEATS